MAQFAIHESNLERLEKKINRIRNKCHKYGCDFYYEQIGEEFRVINEGEDDEHIERYILVECYGTAKVNGWRFAATIDHTPHGNMFRKFIQDQEIPERYYNADPECEHCHSKRHRKDTYLVYNDETGEFKQVGSSCLCDFTGGFSAEAAASYIALFDGLMEFEAPAPGYNGTCWNDMHQLLCLAVDVVNNLGYSSSTYPDGSYNPDSTKIWVSDMLRVLSGRASDDTRNRVNDYWFRFGKHFEDESVVEAANNIINYFKEVEDSSDYIHNLKVIANSEYVELKSLGYLVSMVPTYNKAVERKKQDELRKKSEADERSRSIHVGDAGDRIEITNPVVSVVTSWDTMYGMTIRYKIKDADGNVFMWDSSSYIDDHREVQSIKATVKKFDTFRDVKQTWITRGRVQYGKLLG